MEKVKNFRGSYLWREATDFGASKWIRCRRWCTTKLLLDVLNKAAQKNCKVPKTERRWLFWPLQKTIFIFSPSKHPLDQHKTIAIMKEHQILYRMVHKRQNLGVPELLQKSPGNPHLRFQSKRLVLRFALLCCFPRKNYVKETRTMVFGVEESFYAL